MNAVTPLRAFIGILHTTLTGMKGAATMTHTQIIEMLNGRETEKKNGVSWVKIMTDAKDMIQKVKCGSVTANPVRTIMRAILLWC